MSTAFPAVSFEVAVREFVLHLKATRAAKTVYYYRFQLSMLTRRANDNDVRFGKRHLDRYVAFRSQEGKSRMTLRHDGMCAKVFYAWCAKNDLLDRSPLAEYEIHNAPRPAKHMPTDDEIVALLAAVQNYWNPESNPAIRFMPHAARIGEMLALKIGDYRAKERQIVIRESKGKESRALPVSPEWASQMEVWLRVRAWVMQNVPKANDEGWLFISDTGAKIDEGSFLKILHRVTAFAELTDAITLHSLRRYSLNKLAKMNLLMAQAIAGHKETKTTLLYTKLDPDFVRDLHGQTGVLRNVVSSKHAVKRKQLI